MRMIFEQVDNDDFFELILTEKEAEKIPVRSHGIVCDFPSGLDGRRNWNVSIRMETEKEKDEREEKYAIEKIEKQKCRFGKYPY